jgi:hypothetical protein
MTVRGLSLARVTQKMTRFAPWYRREDYALIREIMEDAEDTLPLAFDEWEENAESERETARRELVFIEPVFLDPVEFFDHCKEKKITPNKTTASEFASSRGVARYSMGM